MWNWKYCKSTALQNLLISHDSLPHKHIDNRMLIENVKSNQIEKFQVEYMFYPVLNHSKAL